MNPFGFAYVTAQIGPWIHIYRVGADGAWNALTNAYQNLGLDGPFTFLPHPSRRLLYALDTENRLHCFHVKPDGSLTPTRPASIQAGSNLAYPSFDAHGKFFYAIDQNDGPDLIRQFRVASSGVPVPLRPSAVRTIEKPGFVVAHPTKPFLYVTGDKGVYLYRIGETGALIPLPKPLPPTSGTAGHLLFHPSGRFAYLFKSRIGGDRQYCIEQYRVESDGALKPLSPFRIYTLIVDAVFPVHPSGRFLYVHTTGDPDKTWRYNIAANGALGVPQTVKAEGINERTPLLFDRTGKFAYIVSNIDEENSLVRAYVVTPDGNIQTNRCVAPRMIETARSAACVIM